jgi:HSP20 family protein
MKLRDPAVWIWGDALELLERADRLHRQFFQPGHHRNPCPTWEPPVDMFETERELVVLVALPGVTAAQLEVTVDGAVVIVRGQRAMPASCRSATIHRLEIPYGRFERRIELPAGQFQAGQQMLKDGCLMLTLNKLG